ncbi:HNH endonuclease [Streptomyces sp. NPDC003832]
MAARRAEFFAGKSCVRCGSTERLELDHIEPGAKVTHRIWSWSAERRATELAKCQPLCAGCHRSKSDAALAVPHGGGSKGRTGCKCEPCTLRRREYDRERKRAARAR